MTPTAATAPALRVAPSMIEASCSLRPSWLNTAPRPALNSGESSITMIAAITASTLLPPRASTAWPAASEAASAAVYPASRSGVILPRSMVPAPPWITRRVGDAAQACVLAIMRQRARLKRTARIVVFRANVGKLRGAALLHCAQPPAL